MDVSRFADRWKSHILETFSADSEGRPQWIQDLEKGEDEGWFGPGSAVWAVHGGMPTLVAGIRALLMQTLHPGAMAGVHDWSRYREDPLGRLAGTVRWVITTSFGDQATAVDVSRRVRGYHRKVQGTFVDGHGVERPYSANDPDLLSWVHIVFTDAFLSTHMQWGPPIPGGPDRYVAEWAKAGELMGVEAPPRSHAELHAQIDAFHDQGLLRADERTRETISFLREPPLRASMLPAYRVLFAGAVASLEPRYRELLGLDKASFGPFPLPALASTRVMLGVAGRVMGDQSTSHEAALKRIARLRDEHASTGAASGESPDPHPGHGDDVGDRARPAA
ncbi:oxygenase MpaB family protein [Clavibacter michiganensis]|uniref:ER-bound oxygenase mpaB/mpaB'/Rubber oxygenase catalytic domain-containing protein n=1 Tax=Clavibacter michiganensis TaxID=28447 RepID=A0A251YLF9_9MICO|nr:oxygenase MpaB family protein [Clavibacter michiganensis]OUE24858.1 hypothetical protein BFL37_08645 [Clavibacter michiganensis]